MNFIAAALLIAAIAATALTTCDRSKSNAEKRRERHVHMSAEQIEAESFTGGDSGIL